MVGRIFGVLHQLREGFPAVFDGDALKDACNLAANPRRTIRACGSGHLFEDVAGALADSRRALVAFAASLPDLEVLSDKGISPAANVFVAVIEVLDRPAAATEADGGAVDPLVPAAP